MLASMQETYLYHENMSDHSENQPMVGLIFAMVGRQFWTSLCIEMVSKDLLSCFFTILYHLLDCKMVSDRF